MDGLEIILPESTRQNKEIWKIEYWIREDQERIEEPENPIEES